MSSHSHYVRAATLAATVLVGSIFGCAQQLETDDATEAIVNGAESTGDDAVVALVANGNAFCSGTLVTPLIVLTAAHCVPPHVDVDVQHLDVFFGASVNGPGETIPAFAALAFPTWSANVVSGDIGIIALTRPANAVPIPMLAQPLEMLDLVGDSARVVGFGVTETGGGGGVKRSGTMDVVDIDTTTIFLDDGAGQVATCNGDSGGPLLATVAGVETLVGIHSRSNCESSALNERVDIHARDFVLRFVETLGGQADCYADGLCAEGCDEPDPDCLCAADGLCTEDCGAPATDPDCPESCAGDDCGELAGCQSTGNAQGGLGMLMLLLSLAFIRRRRLS